MLKLFMDKDINYLEVFFDQSPNYGEEDKKGVLVFKAEKNDKVIGYGFFDPLKTVSASTYLLPKIKIAIICFVNRSLSELSERAMAEKLSISYRTYQRIEEGEISKIDDLFKISECIPDLDLSMLFKAS